MEGWGEVVPEREQGGKGRRGGGGSDERGRGVGGGGEEGGGDAGGGTEGGGERQRAHSPVDARVVAPQPRKPEHHLEVAQPGHLKGEILRVRPMDTQLGGEVVSDRARGRHTAIDEFQLDRAGVGKGVQMIANQDGGVQEAVRGTRIDQRLDGDWRLTGDEEVHQESKVRGGGEREGGGKGKNAAQPGSYWLGLEFFDSSAAAAAAAIAAAATAAAWGFAMRFPGPGKGPSYG